VQGAPIEALFSLNATPRGTAILSCKAAIAHLSVKNLFLVQQCANTAVNGHAVPPLALSDIALRAGGLLQTVGPFGIVLREGLSCVAAAIEDFLD